MKKWKILLLLGVTGLIIGLVLFWPKDPQKYYIKKYSEKLDIDLNSGKLVSYQDDHGGFQGDGSRFMVIDLSEAGGLKDLGKLQSMPMPDFLAGYVFKQNYSTTLPDIPVPRNGYYFYENKNSGRSEMDFLGPLWNFIFAVYDADTKLLYIGECDI